MLSVVADARPLTALRFAGSAGGVVVEQRLESRANQRDRRGQIAKHQLCFEADYAVAETAELAVTVGVRCAAARVLAAIYFNNQPDCGGEEIWLCSAGPASGCI